MHEMTPSEMLKDPLIRQMLRADKISLASFAALLDAAARERAGPPREQGLTPSRTPEGLNLDAAAFI